MQIFLCARSEFNRYHLCYVSNVIKCCFAFDCFTFAPTEQKIDGQMETEAHRHRHSYKLDQHAHWKSMGEKVFHFETLTNLQRRKLQRGQTIQNCVATQQKHSKWNTRTLWPTTSCLLLNAKL